MAEEDPTRDSPEGGAPSAEPDQDEDRAAILARRRALIRRAVASIGAVVVSGLVTDCSSVVGPGTGDAAPSADAPSGDATPQACLRFAPSDTGPETISPQPCLSAPFDVQPPPDAVSIDSAPKPCLDVAFDAGNPDR